jgi:hypothetical protein
VEKPRLARQTSIGCLLAAAALLSAVVVAGPAQAAAAHHAHHAARRHGTRSHRSASPVQRRAAKHRAGPGLPSMRVLTAPGFDTCWAPPVATMQTWHNDSAYRAVGIYIGGRNRACVGGNLTPSWVSAVSAQGWGLIPVYVGLQAPCVTEKGMTRMAPAQAAQQGTSEANDAASQAAAYGLAKGSPVYFDLEAFKQTDQGCVTTVLAYLNAWTRQLHADGYYAGVYGSAASGIITLAQAVQNQSSFTAPDAIWIARWDQQAKTADGSVPDDLWGGHQRIKQYQGGHVEKHGGAAIDIDSDYLDGPVARVQ